MAAHAHPPKTPALHTTQTRNAYLILAATILAATLSSPLSPSTQLQHLFAGAPAFFQGVLYRAWVGLYCFNAWFAVVTGQFWILDVLGGRAGQVCGNKFLDCRPWG